MIKNTYLTTLKTSKFARTFTIYGIAENRKLFATENIKNNSSMSRTSALYFWDNILHEHWNKKS